jgi:hypothetical protein
MHYPTRPVDRDKAEHELVVNIKKATSTDETAPKQKHVRSEFITIHPPCLAAHRRRECIVYTWDYHSSISFWSGLRVQPILSDEVQTFKALITVHKVLQEGHPIVRVYNIIFIVVYSEVNHRLSKKPTGRQHGLRLVRGRWDMMAFGVSIT